MSAVLRSDSDGVATLTLNRPHKRNALDGETFEALRGHLEAIISEGAAVGCVVITGSGPSFCAGADVEMMRAGASTADWVRRAETVDLFDELPQPVIAAVRGHCYAGGLEVALAADVIVVSDTVRMKDLHVQLGGHPAWGLTARLPRRVGASRAKLMFLLQTEVNAEEAVRIGLADLMASDDQLDDKVAEMAKTIAGNSRPANFRLKHLVNRSLQTTLADQIAYERTYRGRVRQSDAW